MALRHFFLKPLNNSSNVSEKGYSLLQTVLSQFVLISPSPFFHYSSASNRIIAAKDHASIQMNIADVDPETGRMTGTWKTYAICGAIRRMGESDDCINRLAKKDGILSKNF